MNYYITKIEQIISNGAYTEYANTEKVATLSLTETKFFQALANVSADIGKNHTYMLIEIKDSLGNIIRKDVVGRYVVDETDATE